MGNFNIEDVTVCLHCGSRPDIVERQTQELKGLGDYYNITWNNRIDRYPYAYPSYSELINDAIATSKDEFIIFGDLEINMFPLEKEVSFLVKWWAM